MTLAELKEKYPLDAIRMKHKPLAYCPHCEGTGEYEDTRSLPMWCGCVTLTGTKEQNLNIMQHLHELNIKCKASPLKAGAVVVAAKPKSKTKRRR